MSKQTKDGPGNSAISRQDADHGKRLLRGVLSRVYNPPDLNDMSDIKTIGQAKQLYKVDGPAIYSDDTALVNLIQTIRWKVGLQNTNFLHAISLTDLLFQNTSD